MAVSFEKLRIGSDYERPYLADLWGYKSHHAISRGVVTPAGTKFIILFVTKDKQDSLTQYNDYIDGDVLHWEGEEKHGSDERIINASKAFDAIHLFYRDVHHTPFTYYGEIFLKEYKIHLDRPSQYRFSMRSGAFVPEADVIDDLRSHTGDYQSLSKTEQDAIVKSRIGQGVFRDRLIEFWGSCSVTGLENLSLLRASHVKPWRHSTNQERLDPMNGLLLTPNLDHLFDSGFITFDDNGNIQISEELLEQDLKILHLDRSSKLRKMPVDLKKYMQFHRENIFKQK